MNDIVLSDYLAVLPICTNWKSSRLGTIDCYEIFLKNDGSWNMVSHGYIQGTDPMWHENTLYFSDLKHEYIMKDGNTPIVHDLKKEGLLQDAGSVYFNDKFVSFYNWGYNEEDSQEEGEYSYEMVVVDKEKAARYILPFFLLADSLICHGHLVSLVETKVNGEEKDRSVYSFSLDGKYEKILEAKYPYIDGVKQKIGTESHIFQCNNDSDVMGIAYVENPSVEEDGRKNIDLMIEKWDLERHEYSLIPLLEEDNEKFSINDDYDYLEVLIVDDSTMYAQLGMQGRIAKIDISTGKLHLLNEPLQTVDDQGNYHYNVYSDYLHGKLYQFVEDPYREEDPYLRIVDVHTGKVLQKIEYKGLNKGIRSLSPFSLEVNPSVAK